MTLLCSGPGAAAYTSVNLYIGFLCLVTNWILFTYTYWLREKKHLNNNLIVRFLGFFSIFPPLLFLGSAKGDCGATQVTASYLIIGISITTLLYEFIKEKIITNGST